MSSSERSSLISLIAHEVKEGLIDTTKKKSITILLLIQLFITTLFNILKLIGYGLAIEDFSINLGPTFHFVVNCIRLIQDLALPLFALDAIVSLNVHQFNMFLALSFIFYFMNCFETVALVMFELKDPAQSVLSSPISKFAWFNEILCFFDIFLRGIIGGLLGFFYIKLRSDLIWGIYRRMGANYYSFKLMMKRQALWSLIKWSPFQFASSFVGYYYIKMVAVTTQSKVKLTLTEVRIDIVSTMATVIAFWLLLFISLKKDMKFPMAFSILFFSASLGYGIYMIYNITSLINQLSNLYKNSGIYISALINVYISFTLTLIIILAIVSLSFICITNFGMGLANINFYFHPTGPGSILQGPNEGEVSENPSNTSLLESSTDLSSFLRPESRNEITPSPSNIS